MKEPFLLFGDVKQHFHPNTMNTIKASYDEYR